MKLNVLITGLCLGIAPIATGHVSAQTADVTTKYITVDGEVVRYEPGKVMVLRTSDGKEVLYTLPATVTMPADVQVGRRVRVFTEPSATGGTQIVSRVTTTSVTPEGNIKKTTETTRTDEAGVTTKTTHTQVSGNVTAYEPGKTLTITRADGTQATYIITGTSKVPTDLVVGKTIQIVPSATGELTVQTVTYLKPMR